MLLKAVNAEHLASVTAVLLFITSIHYYCSSILLVWSFEVKLIFKYFLSTSDLYGLICLFSFSLDCLVCENPQVIP